MAIDIAVTTNQRPELVNGKIVVTFAGGGTFHAKDAAEAWCRENGISFGQGSARWPYIGLLYGDYDIAKWHNLSPKQRKECHGTMTGNMRNGPVTIAIKPRDQCAPPSVAAQMNTG